MAKKYKNKQINLLKASEDSLAGEAIAPDKSISPRHKCRARIRQLKLFELPILDNDLLELTDLFAEIVAKYKPIHINKVNIVKLKKRFDFLEIELMAAKVFLIFCMHLHRSEARDLLCRGKDCIDKHHTRLGERIGKFNEVALITIFLCSDKAYLKKYFAYIENNRALFDSNYIKRTSM